jgi:hypothetical protein
MGRMETLIVEGGNPSTALRGFLLTSEVVKNDGTSGVRPGKYSLAQSVKEHRKNKCYLSEIKQCMHHRD